MGKRRGWHVYLRHPYALLFLFAMLHAAQAHLAFWLVWISFVPCFTLLLEEKQKKRGLRWACALGAITATGEVYWFVYYKVFVFVLALLAWIAFFCLLYLAATWLERRWNRGKLLAYPICWTALSLMASFTPMGNFLFNLGRVQPDMAPLIWIVKGMGITFLIVLTNATAAGWLLEKRKKLLWLLLGLLILIGACKAYSNVDTSNRDMTSITIRGLDNTPPEKPLTVALVQGNFSQSWPWRVAHAEEIFTRYFYLSYTAAEHHPDIIVWPEYAIPRDINETFTTGYQQELRRLARDTNATIIAGTLRYLPGKEGNTDTAVIVTPEGGVRFYDSPLPFPYGKDVAPGNMKPEDSVLQVNNASIAVSLCYEETNMRHVSTLRRGGASLVIFMVNNQIFKDSIGLKITAQLSRLRAAENRVWIARSANTGITQIVNPKGKVTRSLQPLREGVLIGRVYDDRKDKK